MPAFVSFTDTNGIAHAVEFTASSLYEAAALAIAEFRGCGFTTNAPGPATQLTVTVKVPATSHEVRLSKIPGAVIAIGSNRPSAAAIVRMLISVEPLRASRIA